MEDEWLVERGFTFRPIDHNGLDRIGNFAV